MSATAAYTAVLFLKVTNSAFTAPGDEVGGINKVSIKINGEQLDVSKFKSQVAWREYIQGLKNFQIDLSGFIDRADTAQQLIRTKLLTPGNLFGQIELTPGGATGSKGFMGQVNVESYTEDGDVGGLSNFSATLKGTAALGVDV